MRGGENTDKQELTDLVICVDFYKPTSGKWYAGGEVNIGQSRLWKDDFTQAIVNNQTIMIDGWQGRYIVVTSDQPETEPDPNYTEFCKHVFMPHVFAGLKRQNP